MTLIPSASLALSSAVLGSLISAGGRDRLFRPQRPRYTTREYENASMRAVERTLRSADSDFLASRVVETRDLRRHLRSSRKLFLKLYLKQMRSAFLASARVAREFAADSDAPELAFAVLRQTIRFHLLSIALRLSLVFRLTGTAWRLTETLLRAARPSAVTATPAPQPAARP